MSLGKAYTSNDLLLLIAFKADLEKAIQESEQAADFDARLLSIAHKVLINTKIQSVIEKLE